MKTRKSILFVIILLIGLTILIFLPHNTYGDDKIPPPKPIANTYKAQFQEILKEEAHKKAVAKAKAKAKAEAKLKKQKASEWYVTTARITEYCPECNDPCGSHQSSSGKYLTDGDCACSWLAIGTEVKINGSIYTVVDRCGTDAIDIFRDTATCQCDLNETTTVYIKK